MKLKQAGNEGGMAGQQKNNSQTAAHTRRKKPVQTWAVIVYLCVSSLALKFKFVIYRSIDTIQRRKQALYL